MLVYDCVSLFCRESVRVVPLSQSLRAFLRYNVLMLYVLCVSIGGGGGFSWSDVSDETSGPC